MNHTTTFNTLQFTKKMVNAGFTQQQAEGQAEALIEIVDNNLATKTDIFLIQRDISLVQKDIKEVELKLELEIESVKVEIEKSKNETIKWLGLIITLATTIIGILITRYHG